MKTRLSRKAFLKGAAALGALATLGPLVRVASGLVPDIATRKIPKSGEALPVIGLGTAYEFGESGGIEDFNIRKDIIRTLIENGGTLIDTAPHFSYGVAEGIIGKALDDLRARPRVFLATKISTYGAEAGVKSVQTSLRDLRTTTLDLVQVHNLKDTATHLKTLRRLKEKGTIRYFGVTHYLDSGLPGLVEALKAETPDFVQCHYSALEREAERRVLPLAADKGAAVIANRPFARGEVFRRTRGRGIPAWAMEELGIRSWGQFFLKFTLSHPAVTVAIPGTEKPIHMLDNAGALQGGLPDAAQRQKMISWLQTL
ncbi:MAG TPA: aldo/keto reductase [Sphingomonadales bacterium]|nr:aldo/keto reductase [Sphingomonadales bacterium]